MSAPSFRDFADAFQVVDHSATGQAWTPDNVEPRGFAEFMRDYAGATVAEGAYRIHTSDSAQSSKRLMDAAFPEFADRCFPFGFDWLGRQFALDAHRTEGGEALVMLLEVGTGQALEIPTGFASFHNRELVDFRNEALAWDFFLDWVKQRPETVPLLSDQCVGYKVPLFLGGRDELDNLELIDLEVYWTLCGQLRLGTLHLPPGTTVQEVRDPEFAPPHLRLADVLDRLETFDDEATVFVESGSPTDGDSRATVSGPDEDDREPPAGFAYVLEIGLMKDVLQVWSAWRGGAQPTSREKCEAVLYYSSNDAYLPP